MPKHFWFKFEWTAWRSDKQLRRCTKETRGFWIDCIAEMEDQNAYFLEGTPEQLCRDLFCTQAEFDRSVADLIATNAASITKCQDFVKLVSRRLLKKHNLTEYNRLKKREERCQTNVNVMSNAPSKDKILREEREEEIKKEKELREEEEKRGEKPNAAKPPPKPVDHRKVHPAIIGVWKTTGKYPPKELWDELIDSMGDQIDDVALKKCWIQWRAKGFKPTNYAWALEWYRDGIPETKYGAYRDNITGSQPTKPTSVSRLAETARVLSQYPTEAELRDRQGAG